MFTENITFEAYQKLLELDKTFLGTANYMGVAYFWNIEYKHYLRDASQVKRQKVHKAFLDAGLELSGDSIDHEKIIVKYFKNARF